MVSSRNLALVLLALACIGLAAQLALTQQAASAPAAPPAVGRYQMVVVAGSRSVIDTATGDIWSCVYNRSSYTWHSVVKGPPKELPAEKQP